MADRIVRAVVFDLDGTLVDAFADIAAAINGPLRRRGHPGYSVEQVKALVGEGVGRLIERATPPGMEAFVEDIRREMMAAYKAAPADLATLYDGVPEVLQALRRAGVKCAVLSNKPHPMAVKTCEDLGIATLLDLIVGEDGGSTPRKPDPTGLLGAVARLGATSAIVVGDGIPDGEVARNAGMPFVACLWGTRTRADLEAYAPVAVAEHPRDLLSILPAILGIPRA